ncbi:MAG: glycosyltransferase family 2 protein [Parachlamydiaceae bacterium]
MEENASIILVSYNSAKLILQNLEQIVKLPYQIIVVDNASNDQTVQKIKNRYPSVKVIASEKNLGYGAANNLGVKEASKEYLVLLNVDAFITEEAIIEAIDTLKRFPSVGLIGGMLIGLDGKLQPSKRRYPTFKRRFLQKFGLADKWPKSPFFGEAEMTWVNPNIPQYVDWLPTAFAVIRKELFERVGGFDERLFLYYEDLDLCRRINEAGYKVLYWPLIKITHIGGGASVSDKLQAYEISSAIRYHKIHDGFKGILGYLFSEGAFHFLRALKHSFPGGIKEKRDSSINAIKEMYANLVRM